MNKNPKAIKSFGIRILILIESANIKPQNFNQLFIMSISCSKLQCVGCDTVFTVRHFLLECGDFAQVRNNCFRLDYMKQLFQDIHIDTIRTLLKEIDLFNEI